jgi:hypothetical protein
MTSLTKDEEQEMVALYDMEWSITALAKRFGCNTTYVKRVLRDYGLIVELRQRHGVYVPTLTEIEQAKAIMREGHLRRKKEETRQYVRRPAQIRVVKVTSDKNGIYLEPV